MAKYMFPLGGADLTAGTEPLDHQDVEPVARGEHRGGEPRGAGADHDNVEFPHLRPQHREDVVHEKIWGRAIHRAVVVLMHGQAPVSMILKVS